MKVLLNGKESNKALLTVNSGLNFGRFFDKETKPYELRLSHPEFINLIEKEYDNTRNEIKIDDESLNDTSDFSRTRYCSLKELLVFEPELSSIVKTYLDQTLFLKVFTDRPENQFIINSTDTIISTKHEIIIKGRVFEVPSN